MDIEFDTIELARGCAHRCLHCSEAPDARVQFASRIALESGLTSVAVLERRLQQRLWAKYWLPFPASEPFDAEDLPWLCARMHARAGVPAYILTKAPEHARSRRIVRDLMDIKATIFRIGITISNFSAEAQGDRDRHARSIANMLCLLKPLWDVMGPDNRPIVFVTPQFVSGAAAADPLSEANAFNTLDQVAAMAGFNVATWLASEQVIARPVVALGRAATHLGVTRRETVMLSPEACASEVSLSPERKWSGMIAADGSLECIRMPRGQLGRLRGMWKPIESVVNWHDASIAAVR